MALWRWLKWKDGLTDSHGSLVSAVPLWPEVKEVQDARNVKQKCGHYNHQPP